MQSFNVVVVVVIIIVVVVVVVADVARFKGLTTLLLKIQVF